MVDLKPHLGLNPLFTLCTRICINNLPYNSLVIYIIFSYFYQYNIPSNVDTIRLLSRLCSVDDVDADTVGWLVGGGCVTVSVCIGVLC